MAWISDPWMVGIGTGIVSGLAVLIVTRWLDRRKKAGNLSQAESDVKSALRTALVNGTLPSVPIVEAMLRAAAARHGVPPDDIAACGDVADDLALDVMESPFLTGEQKAAHATSLAALWGTQDFDAADPPTRQSSAGPSLAILSGLLVLVFYLYANQGVAVAITVAMFLIVGVVTLAALAFVLVTKLSATQRSHSTRKDLEPGK